MIDIDELEKFIAWQREKQLYPPKYGPDEYLEHILNMESRAKVLALYNIYDTLDPDFLASNSNELTDMIEKILHD
jgi:hypothetical protein